MKKLLFAAAIAVFGFSTVNAQDLSFGAKVGANFASVGGDDSDDLDGKTAFHVGAVINIGISEKFAIQPELVYSTQGYTASFDGVDVTGKLDYINLPILVDYTIISGLSIQAGPQIGFNIKDEMVADDVDDVSLDLDAESIDIAGALGAQFKMGSGLFFQARYTFGFSEIVEDVDIKNNVFSLGVGYFF